MENKPIDITMEIKKAERKRKLEELKKNALNYWENNKATVITVGTAALYGIGKAAKAIGRVAAAKQEQHNKELYCYDNRLGHYWELRRKLKNSEWSEIDQRKRKGEALSDILRDLKVLK